LFRKANGAIGHDFHGTLSFAWPRTPLQFGTDTPGQPLFPLGYGLRDASNGNLGRLPEQSGLSASAATSVDVYFAAGRPGPGWHWLAANDITPVDDVKQEDARALHFNGQGPSLAGLSGHSPVDLSRQTNGQLALGFDYRLDLAPSAPVSISMACGPRCAGSIAITAELRRAPLERWQHLKIPLACFAHAGADMSHITMPFGIATTGRLVLSVANIRLQSGMTGLLSCAR
ncbi:MAG TPA: putative glycoside hydrolase, partial [Steroidobacteraceae bacterium]|nr:putative glycoside hydrolase [Steroidobacteraceae bacterium]